jgi:nitrite reductase (NAD(P)H)
LDRRLGPNGVGMKGRKPFEAKKELKVGGEREGGIDW